VFPSRQVAPGQTVAWSISRCWQRCFQVLSSIRGSRWKLTRTGLVAVLLLLMLLLLRLLVHCCCCSLCFSSCQEKQRWLKVFVPESAHLFADVGRLGMDRVVDWKAANGTGTLVDLMSVLFFVAGFSCKSVSYLNPQRQQHSHSIDHSGTTGTTLKGLQQQYIT